MVHRTRSFRSVRSLAAALGAALSVACGSLFGIGDLPALADRTDGGPNAGQGEGGSEPNDGDVADPDGAKRDGAKPTGDAETVVDPRWALWPIPEDAPKAASFQIDNAAGGATVKDLVTGLLWQDVVTKAKRNVADSRAYCDDLVYGSFDDWRLPTRIELVSILSFEADTLKLEPTAMNGVADIGAGYWSTSLVDSNTLIADSWATESSGVRLRTATTLNYARCVRLAPPVGPHGRPDWNVDATSVRDPSTSLAWERSPPTTVMSTAAGASRCAALMLRGKAARLPTAKELASIVDESAYGPALDSNFGSTGGFVMTSSIRPSPFWEVDFLTGETKSTYAGDTARTRCVVSD